MEKDEDVKPVEGITVGRIVHYTMAMEPREGWKPSKPLAAIVVEVSETTGKPTLMVWKTEMQFGVPGCPTAIMSAVFVDVEFSKEPAGTMAARGCWSWPAKTK